MFMYMVIGGPGQGKSPFVRSLIGEMNRCLVFDVQNEYGARTKYPGQKPVNLTNNNADLRSRYIGGDLKKFVELCMNKRNTICVFEEATGFFQGIIGRETTRLIINRYHTGNVYVFLFHSINSVPPRLMELSSIVVLFRTNDETEKVYRKYSRLGPYFDDLQTKPNGSKTIIQML
jgi:hypothetical protein